jgi:hypothetical protein
MVMRSKNQGRIKVNIYEGIHDCLRRHNYSTGAGYKSKNRKPLKFSYRNAKLNRVGRV